MGTRVNAVSGRVAGKIALVAGAGSGIGRASALALAAQGATAICADLNPDGARQAADRVKAAGGSASSCQLDVASEAAWERTMEEVLTTHGKLHIVINSAGISFARPVWEMTLAEWRRVMAINLEGVFLGTKHAILAMRRHAEGGSIINVSSASGIKAAPGASAYASSKAAVCMFSKTAALECKRQGDKIRINTVVPSGVKTPLWKEMPFFQELMAQTGSEEAAFQAMNQTDPYGRFAEPEEIALAILYLASDESLFVTGSDLVIDNGFTA
jgi:3(or 17)beta-hydroxysteroid dehydrogenase